MKLVWTQGFPLRNPSFQWVASEETHCEPTRSAIVSARVLWWHPQHSSFRRVHHRISIIKIYRNMATPMAMIRLSRGFWMKMFSGTQCPQCAHFLARFEYISPQAEHFCIFDGSIVCRSMYRLFHYRRVYDEIARDPRDCIRASRYPLIHIRA